MGRKTKLGKKRKDKFYHLAKETGYRARSAFKLVQLNRKYNFLQSSRVLIDLCAAPGGWLQVAAKSMPLSSLIVGVDLFPIKPIPNIITLQADITTARCKQLLQKELKTWKADCVLNDGAPNVGAAWVQDAFSQAELALAALKLACSFLKKGGCFVTKVFRSKDYQSLMWVLQQLFKHVHATKPQASRLESAEIFVVCRGYLAPSSIDEKMLDPKHVFQEVEEVEKADEKINLVKLQKPTKAAEGYPDDARVLFKYTPVSDFVLGDNHLGILRDSHELQFDRTSEVFSRHPLTTDDIRETCRDLKVVGARELKQLVKWREKMRKFLEEVGSEGEVEEEEGGGGVEGGEGSAGEGEGLDGIDEKVEALAVKESAAVRRELRYLRKQKKKLKERLVVKGGVAEESGELIRQENLFRLKNPRVHEDVERWEEPDGCGQEGEGSGQEEVGSGQEDEGSGLEDEGSGLEDEGSGQEEVGSGLEDEGSGQEGVGSGLEAERSGQNEAKGSQDEDLSGVEDEEVASEEERGRKVDKKGRMCGSGGAKEHGFEEVPAAAQNKKRKLDPEGLAMGALVIQSKKKREDLIESGYNRWTSNDEGLPDWFAEEEAKFCKKQLPITKEMVEVYRAKLKEIDARPIKKVAEAKARKKKRALRTMERARKKAEVITDADDISSQEKAQQIKQIYKKAGALGKKKNVHVEYVVAKKGMGKRVRRPAGVKGRFKVVDPRMKKDNRAAKVGKGKGRGKGGSMGKGKGRKQQRRKR